MGEYTRRELLISSVLVALGGGCITIHRDKDSSDSELYERRAKQFEKAYKQIEKELEKK